MIHGAARLPRLTPSHPLKESSQGHDAFEPGDDSSEASTLPTDMLVGSDSAAPAWTPIKLSPWVRARI